MMLHFNFVKSSPFRDCGMWAKSSKSRQCYPLLRRVTERGQ